MGQYKHLNNGTNVPECKKEAGVEKHILVLVGQIQNTKKEEMLLWE